ncbi:MAG TPA: hypothetical protein PLV06_13690 [Bacteroidales bacterium]|nr:hypothetical protein [Bacteroidales bacterium]HPF02834.1 hypothetical protein [Bacteroidales bacterium]HPJ60242.1 hypothetical protein [Bacteroidales bacterium]HPR13435.1 hypothetical protein [Bacteroidales bacterium]HRW86442.1 hypothetical protein [Bacteroidales bacterium]
MKRIFTTFLVLLTAGTLPYNLALGQEKKTEKKIKVVVADKDGEKVVLDTVFTGSDLPGEVEFKDGRVLLIAENGDKSEWTVKSSSSSEPHIMVFSGSKKDDSGIEKKVIITSEPEGSKEWRQKDGEQVVIVDESRISEITEDGKTIRIMVKEDTESRPGMSSYVIAKDGVVVTVEYDDEKKGQEIIRELEKIMEKK